MYGRRLTAQQKDERRQDNGDKKRLARHHPSDLLRSLSRERIGGGQHGVVSPALRASPFRTFHVLRVRHLMRMRIPSWILALYSNCVWAYPQLRTGKRAKVAGNLLHVSSYRV